MDITGLIADQMGLFTPYDILGALISVVLAALLGLVTARATGGDRSLVVWAALAAFAVAVVRASVPMAIALVAVVMLVRSSGPPADQRTQALRAVALVLGAGCGTGAGIITAVCAIPLLLLLRWALPKLNP
jgi:hypothetical protein